jgi:hypothetical protein
LRMNVGVVANGIFGLGAVAAGIFAIATDFSQSTLRA